MDNRLVSDIMKKMIDYSSGNLHDIAHFMKVYAFARNIGIEEGLSDVLQQTLEITAILHDIACPFCREKYGNTDGKHQEEESEHLLRDFMSGLEIQERMRERIIYLVSHHHTYENVVGLDYQILLEADFLVNADEGKMTKDAIVNAKKRFFKTATGIKILDSMYLREE